MWCVGSRIRPLCAPWYSRVERQEYQNCCAACAGPIDLPTAVSPTDGDPADSDDEQEQADDAMDAATASWLRSTCAPAASYVLERRAPATLGRLEDVKRFHIGDTAEVHQLKKVGQASHPPSPTVSPPRCGTRRLAMGSDRHAMHFVQVV